MKQETKGEHLKRVFKETMARQKGPIFVEKPSIQAVKHLTYSKRDMYGNCYGFLTVTSTKTGESISALVDSIGNEEHFLREMKINFVSSEEEKPIREFNRLAKGLPYDYKPLICKLFGKSFKAYQAKKEKERIDRDKYYQEREKDFKKRLKQEARIKAKEEKALINDVPMVQS
jgi:hypothetical protein